MNTQTRNYAWIWPIFLTITWMLRMLCAGAVIGLITIWMGTKTSLGWWNLVLSIGIAVLIFLISDQLVKWLAWPFKILISKLCGFRFNWFRYQWVFINRKKGKLKIQKTARYDKRGACYMLPPECKDENYSMLLYTFGGSIGLVCLAVIGLVVFCCSANKATLWMAALFMFSVMALLGPMEYVVKWVTTDWDSLALSLEPWMKKAFRLMNQVTYFRSMGIWLQDMPEEWFAWEKEFDIVNFSTEWQACYRFQYLFYTERYQEAEQFVEEILEPKMRSVKVKRCVASRLLYIKMALCEDSKLIEQCYEKYKEFLAEPADSEAYRSLHLYLKYIAKLPETAEKYRVLWEEALIGQEERDIKMEREQVEQIDEKWGGTS